MKDMANSRDLWNQSLPSIIHMQCASNIVAQPYIPHRKVARTPLLHVKGWTRLCNNGFMNVNCSLLKNPELLMGFSEQIRAVWAHKGTKTVEALNPKTVA